MMGTMNPTEHFLVGLTNRYDNIEWPTGGSDKANTGFNQTVYFNMFDLSNMPGGYAEGLNDMTVTTNAQVFSRPRMTNETLEVYVAGPHETRHGEKHEGFYRAFIPDKQLETWGADGDPENDLAAMYKGDAASFTVDTSPDDGVWIELDIDYSDGLVRVGSSSAFSGGDDGDGDDGGSGGGFLPPPPSDDDGDAEEDLEDEPDEPTDDADADDDTGEDADDEAPEEPPAAERAADDSDTVPGFGPLAALLALLALGARLRGRR